MEMRSPLSAEDLKEEEEEASSTASRTIEPRLAGGKDRYTRIRSRWRFNRIFARFTQLLGATGDFHMLHLIP